jgi:serine phosphatase RsbU (regulator of sigma subunit)
LRSAHAQGTRFRIEAVYRPAAEVGGDFFHAAEIDAVTRIVVGDVSGKGLGAAMLVSALIGALDANRDTDPSAVLKQLNEMLLLRQQGGFTTCLLLRADPSGTLTIANAGHLAPYIDGCELTLENGLPLGLSADGSYAESTFTLAPGAQLTMLTDGVAEARSPSGELFGFDRAAAISTQSAEEIAHAAQQFGQEDDITVLTLAFAPAEVLHA